jgi:hypothetical protein
MSHVSTIGGGLALLAAGYYLVAAPYLAVQQMQSAIERKDGQAIVDLIDFEALRSDIKTDLMSSMAAQSDDPMTAAFGGALAGGMIDSFLQPEMIAAMINGQASKSGMVKTPNFDDVTVTTTLGIMTMTVTLEGDDGEPLDIVFAPSGLTWKVVGVDFDMSDFS